MPIWATGWARKFLGLDKVISVPPGVVTLTPMASGLTFRNRNDGDAPGTITAFMSRGAVSLTGLPPGVTIFQAVILGPTAAASVSPTSVQIGQPVTLNTAGTHAGTGALATWSVVWGDGNTSSGTGIPPINIVHVYSVVGSFTPVLTVTDVNAKSASATAQTVGVAGLVPVSPTSLTAVLVSSGSGLNLVRGPQPTPVIPVPANAVHILPGQSIQTAINNNVAGTTFYLRAGVHQIAASLVPKSDDVFIGELGAILDGTGWSSGDPDDAFFRGVNNGILRVVITNLVMRNGPAYGVNSYLSSTDWTVSYNEIHHNINGVSVGKSGIITHNWIHHNIGVVDDLILAKRGGGIVLNSSLGAQITFNEVSFNGQEQKFIYGTNNEPSQNLYIAGNWYHHNVHDGIWIDGDGSGSVIENNLSEDNGRTGITVEIGNNVRVQNNIVRRSGAEGILISASRSCTVRGNICEENGFGIGLFLDFQRLIEVYPFWTVDLTDNTMSGNTIRVLAGQKISNLTFTGAGDKTPYLNGSKPNVWVGNTYYAPDTTSAWFIWDTSSKTFIQWQQIPQDAGSTISTTPPAASSVSLHWTDNSNNETGFAVERRISGGGVFAVLTNLAANTTTYSDTAVAAGTTYDYRVRAFNANGSSGYTNTATVTISGAAVPNKTLWAQSDFTALGAFYSVVSNSFGYGMAGIREGGVFKLMEWDEDGTIKKYPPPSPSTSQSPSAIPHPTGIVNMGTPYGVYNGFAFQDLLNTAADMRFHGLYLDTGVTPNRLYWTAPSYYDNTYLTHPVIGYSVPDGSGGWTPIGFWALTETRERGGYGNRWAQCVGAFPSWFTSGYMGGRRLFVSGAGGYFTSIVSNNVAMGPALFGIFDLAGTEAWKSIATSASPKPLLFHPYHSEFPAPSYPSTAGQGDLFPPRIARRRSYQPPINKYMNRAAGTTAPDDPWLPDSSAPNGYWDWNGDSAPAGIWLETANRFGYLTFPTLAQGNYDQTVSAVAYVGIFRGYHYWDITLPTTVGLEPNMQVFLEDPNSIHYGGWQLVIAHSDNIGIPYGTPGAGGATPILSGTKIRVVMVETADTFFDLATAVGKKLAAGCYYGGGGGKCSTFRAHTWVYHPADLVAQAQNNVGPWSELDPRTAWETTYGQRRESFITGTPPIVSVTGLAYDDVAGLLYKRVYGGDLGDGSQNKHMVYVERVNQA